jgi:hypothetical protein
MKSPAQPRWVRTLLLALPKGFRTEYGDEICAHVEWMRDRSLARSSPVRVTAYVVSDVLWVALRERWALAGVVVSQSATVSGRLLAGGALLAFIGTSLGFGAGVWMGFAFVPPALVVFAYGVVARSIAARTGHRWFVWLAVFIGLCAVVLGLQLVLNGLSIDLFGLARTRAMFPAFIGLVAGASVFGLAGVFLRLVPALPGTLAGIGTLMLFAGPLEGERIAELGFWLCVAGWIGLGVSSWPSAPEPVLEDPEASR